jgi:2,4-dienoyl-CoA reductase-like NADH-dependent reductase (Old Yellow Enzyme family)
LNAFAGKGSDTMGLDRLIERMERDEFDLIAVGRALISDPNWVAKIQGTDRESLKGFDAAALSELV